MMRTPTEYEIEQLLQHAADVYDPVKAHEYYLKTRQLKGRQRGSSDDPRTGKTREQIAKDARAHQREELSMRIKSLSAKLAKLEALIKQKEAEARSTKSKSTAKKERAAKEKDKPKTAAEKAKEARDAKKYRQQHKQELKSKAKAHDKKSGGGSKKAKPHTVSELRTLATKVRGQIAIAKQKLAAL
jgi:hypothetical protein